MRRILKAFLVFCVAVCALIVFPTTALHAKVKRLNITSASDKVAISNYHITRVIDERLDTTNIGYITTGANNVFMTANFEYGLTSEFNNYFRENIKQNQNAEAVELHVIRYKLYEKTSFKGAEIAIYTHFALYSKQGGKLFDYVITETRNIGMNMGAFAGELMRRNLLNFIAESDKNLPSLLAMYKTNKPIKVNYFIDKEPEPKNLLPYNPQRPLNVFNFVAKPPASPAVKSVSESGLRIQYQIRNINGQPEGYIEILPYFDQAKAWLASRENSNQTLKYEQIRFKISAFFANELVKEINSKNFMLASFHDDVIAMSKKYNEQIVAYQKQLDEESANGTNAEALDNWNRKVAYYDSYSINK
jgi:hypothetical protein